MTDRPLDPCTLQSIANAALAAVKDKPATHARACFIGDLSKSLSGMAADAVRDTSFGQKTYACVVARASDGLYLVGGSLNLPHFDRLSCHTQMVSKTEADDIVRRLSMRGIPTEVVYAQIVTTRVTNMDEGNQHG